ncbi:MAG: DNA repair protein RecO [Thermoanaerobaculia bacterium]
MHLHTTEALLLDVVDLHEYDRIVTFLTRERGKKRGVARGARRKFSRFGGQLQPLAKVVVTWFEKEDRELVRIRSVELERSAARLQQDLEGILLGSYLADHMLEFAQENEESDYFFRLLDTTLEALMEGVDRQLATRYYEAWMLRLAGIFPPPRECPQCGRDLAGGGVLPSHGEGVVCGSCAAPGPAALTLAPETLDFLRRIGRESLRTLDQRPPGAAVLEVVEKLCARVRRRFLQRELRSYRVIRETLNSVES